MEQVFRKRNRCVYVHLYVCVSTCVCASGLGCTYHHGILYLDGISTINTPLSKNEHPHMYTPYSNQCERNAN